MSLVGGGSEGLLSKTVLRCCQVKPVAVAVSCLSEDLGDIFSLARMKGCWDFSRAVFLCLRALGLCLWKCLDAVQQFPLCGCCPANGLAWKSGKKEFRMGSVLPVCRGTPVFLMDCFASCSSYPWFHWLWSAEQQNVHEVAEIAPFPSLRYASHRFLGVAEGVKDIKPCENGDGILCWWEHWPAVSLIRVQRLSCGRRIFCRCSVQGWKWLLREKKSKSS